MDGHDYEYVVAQYLRGHGYTKAKVTKASGDYGVDVIAHKNGRTYAVQCKYYSNPVGISAVQEVVAGKAFYDCDATMVVTNSTFTKAARDLAKANGVILLECIQSAGSSSKGYKIILWAVYLFVASAIFAAALDAAKGEITGYVVWNMAGVILLLTSPIWIQLVWRLVKKKIKQHKKATMGNTSQATHAKSFVPAHPVVTQAMNIDKEKVQEAILWCDRDLISVDIDGIAQAQNIGVSVIQRRCKVGYDRAMRIIDGLQDLGLLRRDGQGYEWTEKALLLNAEGLNRR